jgi:hypothetical protein
MSLEFEVEFVRVETLLYDLHECVLLQVSEVAATYLVGLGFSQYVLLAINIYIKIPFFLLSPGTSLVLHSSYLFMPLQPRAPTSTYPSPMSAS